VEKKVNYSRKNEKEFPLNPRRCVRFRVADSKQQQQQQHEEGIFNK
jgi:hypothetical protein